MAAVDLPLGTRRTEQPDAQHAAVPAAVPAAMPGLELTVFSLGLACCAVEVAAAAFRDGTDGTIGPDLDPDPGDGPAAHVLVVAGTVTDALAPAVLAAWARLPEPRHVLSFGACSDSGGPYWDSYSVTKGVDQLVPVDVYVPGCPPRPEALLQGLVVLRERIRSGAQQLPESCAP